VRRLTSLPLPASPTSSRYGWPLHLRLDEFEKLHEQPNLPTHRIVFQGENRDLPIIRVPIKLPKYRLANGRTVSKQEEYIATHAGIRADFFTGDPELLDAQEVQHELLLSLANEANLLNYFKDTANKQVQPLLLDENGFVVNGNRRLAVWRKLIEEDPGRYGHFTHIDVVVLPHCDEWEIDRLEAALQIEPDVKADYSWDTKANMIVRKQRRDGLSDKEIAEVYHMKENEVRELIDMREYAVEYLRLRGKESRWSLVSDKEYAFRQIVKHRSKIAGAGERELFKQAAYVLIDEPEAAGERLYKAVPEIREYLPAIKTRLQQEFPVVAPPQDEELDALFGEPGEEGDVVEVTLAEEIQKPENLEDARAIIVDVIETQRQLKRESKAERCLVESLAKAHSALAVAIKDGLRPDARLTGASAQLKELKKQVAIIEEWLARQNA